MGVSVPGCRFRSRPAIPGRGVRVCVFVCALHRFPANPCWVSWCACVRALPVPRHSWLGVVVRVSGFGFGLSPRHSWLGCWGVYVCVRARLVPRESWLRGAVWVSVLGFGFRLRPAIPGWGVGVCVFVCALHRFPANPCWGSWCVCLGLGLGFHPANPDSGVGACVFVCALRLQPASPCWGVRCAGGRVPCLGSVRPVFYVHAWAGSPFCSVRLGFCRLGGCTSLF